MPRGLTKCVADAAAMMLPIGRRHFSPTMSWPLLCIFGHRQGASYRDDDDIPPKARHAGEAPHMREKRFEAMDG